MSVTISSPPTFLGGYVISASANLGWGGETSSCTLKIVEDPDNGITFKKTTALGTPCKFKFGAFEFVGLFQKWTYSEDVSSGRTYDVVLESPSKILDGVIIVLNKFQGTFYKTDDLAKVNAPWTNDNMTYGNSYPTNIINVYAQKENYAFGGHFGAADTNELGYPVSGIVADIKNTITSTKFGGKIYYSNSAFDLDLDNLNEPLGYLGDYRSNADFPTLHALISDICDTGLYDFAYIMTGDTAKNSDIVTSNLKIKLLVMSRRTAPSPTAISDYIDTLKNVADENKTLVSYTVGKELADVETQKIMIGDSATRYFLADRSMIFPIWGTKGVGENTQYYMGNSIFEYDTSIPDNLSRPITAVVDGGSEGNFSIITTNLLEIRCALSSRKAWSAYHVFAAYAGGVWEVAGNNWLGGESNLALFSQMLQEEVIPTDLMETALEVGAAEAAMAQFPYATIKDTDGKKELSMNELFLTLAPNAKRNLLLKQAAIEARFKAVKTIADGAYGKQFMVMIPGEPGGLQNNWRWIMQDVKAEQAWEATQSAWMGQDLKRCFPDMTFYSADGTLESVAVYPNQVNLDYSGAGKYTQVFLGAYGNSIGVSADIDTSLGTNWIEWNVTDSLGNATKATVGFQCVKTDGIPWIDDYTTGKNGWNMLAQIMTGQTIPSSYHMMFGFEDLDFGIGPAMMPPVYLGVPQKSNRYVWGPWFNFSATQGNNGVDGQHGKLSIHQDTEMKPETFGSVDLMNTYADYLVTSSMAQVHEAESGQVTLADLPAGNLGDRMLGSGPYITNININIGVSGIETTYQFNTWTKSFGKIAEYNVKRLMSHNKNIMKFYKKIRDLIRNPPLKTLRYAILGNLDKYRITNPVRNPSMPLVTMFLGNYTDRSGGKKPLVGGAMANVKEAMPAAGLKSDETYMCSVESIYSPITVPNQLS